MAFLDLFPLTTLMFLPIVFLVLYFFHNKNGVPTNWPFVGMLLPILWNRNQLQDYLTEMLEASNGHIMFHGPWFSNMNIVGTTDPADVHYVMVKNFPNFVKGPEFNRIFDVLGDGIFNVDAELWKFQRQMAHSFTGQDRFRRFVIKTLHRKIEGGLVPILDDAVERGIVVDLQDLFTRLTLDSICLFIMGRDPGCLSVELKDVPFSKAMNDILEAIFLRHAVPERVWMLFRWLKIGPERKLSEGWKILDEFIYGLIEEKKKEIKKASVAPFVSNKEDKDIDLLSLYMNGNANTNKWSDRFLRDTVLNLVIAGRDTTGASLSWLFWLISTNPEVESKILEEVKDITNDTKLSPSDIGIEDLSKMVYLHSALCETLRLYPPVPINHKAPLVPDKLPSGYKVDPSIKILFFNYAMGRKKSIWGEDCTEFKPERWISEQGKPKNEPSYKFFSFGAGPRICLGKEMAFIQIKTVVSSLIGKYRFQVVEGHRVTPDQNSVILQMKHGLKVRVLNKT
ncbi:hypothetical protein Drorol1_Dr00005243 [Drosera rotundifolia]